jgi:hypothetical protein
MASLFFIKILYQINFTIKIITKFFKLRKSRGIFDRDKKNHFQQLIVTAYYKDRFKVKVIALQ